ncbi:hypothetical protein WICPIJ_002884, partial [Wickerhamomyces pijperi]
MQTERQAINIDEPNNSRSDYGTNTEPSHYISLSEHFPNTRNSNSKSTNTSDNAVEEEEEEEESAARTEAEHMIEPTADEEEFIQKYGAINVSYITPPKSNAWFTRPYALNYFHDG